MVDINVKCRSCGQKSHIGNMKYHPETGKDLVCADCYNSKLVELNGGSKGQYALNTIRKEKKALPKLKLTGVKERLESNFQPKRNSSDTVDYKCSKCNYSFKRRKSFSVHSVCPYCGGKTSNKKIAIFTDIIQGLD